MGGEEGGEEEGGGEGGGEKGEEEEISLQHYRCDNLRSRTVDCTECCVSVCDSVSSQ